MTSTIYALSDGADKDRMLSPVEMQSTNVIRTNILSVGEESLLEKSNNKNSGINVRVCEISTDFTNSPEQAEAIVAGCYENYGHAGPLFAQYITENLTFAEVAEIRQEKLTQYSDALIAAGCQSKTIRRLAEFGAILLTVAEIAEAALDISFVQSDIIDFLVDQQISTDANTDIGIRAHNALRGFVNSNIGSFITNSSEMWTKSGICLGKIEHPNGGPMEVSIVASEFPKIMSQLGFNNPNLVLQRFKANGYLKFEAGKNYRKRQITSMPDALMKVIWPEKTQREVTKLLCLAYSRVKSAHTYLGKYGRQVYGCTWEKLRESWLYKRCKEWVYNGELIDVAPRTKKIVFEIESSLAT